MQSRNRPVRVLQRDRSRLVAVEPGGATVRKTFIGPDAESLVASATREHERLSRFSEALADVEGAACPRPVELLTGPRPAVRMELAKGAPLSQRLGTPLDDDEMSWLVTVLTQALTVYVRIFSEPYYDFHFRNMLYDGAARQVTFVDFGIPEHLRAAQPTLDGLRPVDASLGNLFGSSLFEAVRPRMVRRVARNRRTLLLAERVVEAVIAGGAALPAGMAATHHGTWTATEAVYRHSASWGPPSHARWYRLFSRQLVRGRRQLDEVFAAATLGTGAPASHRVGS